ncbi:MAG: GGDEF domain-containing protein [Bdellovibrionia bacterium]
MDDEKTALSSLASYQDLFNRLSDGTYLLDPQSYTILEANFACERIWGISSEQLINQSFLQWIEPAQQEELKKSFRVAMRRYYPRVFEASLKSENGLAFTVEIQACPLKLSDEREILQVIVRDIGARREAENKVQLLLNELKTANSKLELLSTTDEMTGLSNFRSFKTQLEKDHERAQRFKVPYGIAFFDIDHFKKYNDRNGHPAGDRLLRKFSEIFKNCCRNTDLPARYGGEEFVVICTETDSAGALVLAERVRKEVESTQFEFSSFQPLGKLTVSVGVASFPNNGATSKEVLNAADKAVYHSKENGRNQVSVAPIDKKSDQP